jgi:hypothetical protein
MAEIDLTREGLRDLAERVADPDATQPFGTYVVAGRGPAAELGRHLERVVFDEFFGNSAELLLHEYGPYDPVSVFLCVIDHEQCLPAGAIRIILPSDLGFKSLDDIHHAWGQPVDEVLARTGVTFDWPYVWDVTTLAVDATYRGERTGGLVSLALYQALVMTSLSCGARWWVTILDTIVLDLIQTRTHAPFSPYEGVPVRPYLDSPASAPVWADVEAWERRIRAADPAMHDILCAGRGLEEVLWTPDWDAAVEVFDAVAPGGLPTRIRRPS